MKHGVNAKCRYGNQYTEKLMQDCQPNLNDFYVGFMNIPVIFFRRFFFRSAPNWPYANKK